MRMGQMRYCTDATFVVRCAEAPPIIVEIRTRTHRETNHK